MRKIPNKQAEALIKDRTINSQSYSKRLASLIKNNLLEKGNLGKRKIELLKKRAINFFMKKTKQVISDIKGISTQKVLDLTSKQEDRINVNRILKYEKKLEKDLKGTSKKEKKEKTNYRADLIAQVELNKIKNKVLIQEAKKNGIKKAMWGTSTSKEKREEHVKLYGTIFDIGTSPAPNGELPGELPNCKCELILLN